MEQSEGPVEEHVKPVAWMPVDAPHGTTLPPEPSQVRRGLLWQIFGPAVRYPRVTIEAILTLASIAVGLYFLPTAATAAPPEEAAIQSIDVVRSANVPVYLADRSADTKGPVNELLVGMDVPAGSKPVTWQLFVVFRNEDHVVDRTASDGVSFGPVVNSHDLGIKGYQALEVDGTMQPGSHSYSEFQNGFNQAVNQGGLANIDHAEPRDVAKVDFVVDGPVPLTVISGSSMAVTLPAMTVVTDNAPAGQAPAQFNAEMLYDGGDYQNLTGGPQIEGGTTWEWFSRDGVFTSTSATGQNQGDKQAEENDLFLAAVMFGLSAAAGAAFAVELVEAIQEARRDKRARSPMVPSTPA